VIEQFDIDDEIRDLLGPEFRYTDEQWKKIANRLPGDPDRNAVRLKMERYCRAYKHEVELLKSVGADRTWRTDKKSHLRLARAARKFMNAYTEPLAAHYELIVREPCHPRGDRRNRLFAEMTAIAEVEEKLARQPGMPGRKTDNCRYWFLGRMLFLWSDLGGRWGTCVDMASRASGSLVSFLVNAAGPVLGSEFTANAAREFVRSFTAEFAKIDREALEESAKSLREHGVWVILTAPDG
jgi:hypothetical protein